MKAWIILLLSIIVLIGGCVEYEPEVKVTGCDFSEPIDQTFAYAPRLVAVMDEYVQKNVPGAVLLVKQQGRYWAYAAGKSSIEKDQPMQPCLLFSSASIAKIYTATLIMQLWEKDKLLLDDPIVKYLPEYITQNIQYSDQITVRMLLNHTSGLPDYWDDTDFSLQWLNDPLDRIAPLDYLRPVFHQSRFTPGSDVYYSNAGYMLLALIIEQIAAQPHEQVLEKNILLPLQLKETYYSDDDLLHLPASMANCYAAYYGDHRMRNVSDIALMQLVNEFGANGVLASPLDYVHFLDALVHGELVKESTLEKMKEWVQGKTSQEPDFGLGLQYFGIFHNRLMYGHSGSSMGGRVFLWHVPDKDMTFFIGINASMETEGPVNASIAALSNALMEILAE